MTWLSGIEVLAANHSALLEIPSLTLQGWLVYELMRLKGVVASIAGYLRVPVDLVLGQVQSGEVKAHVPEAESNTPRMGNHIKSSPTEEQDF